MKNPYLQEETEIIRGQQGKRGRRHWRRLL